LHSSIDPTSSCRRSLARIARTSHPSDLHVELPCPARPKRLLGGALEVGDEVVALLGLLHAGKGHLGARDVLFRVLEVGELRLLLVCRVTAWSRATDQSILGPGDALGLVCVGVGEAGHLARLAAKEAVQLGADLVALAGAQGMALRTPRLLTWLLWTARSRVSCANEP
jgi:hypothetical protein